MDAAEIGQHDERRLKSWKEIATFLNCDERTAKRWETTRGLPVRRLQAGPRSGVFAYPSELQAWLREEDGQSPAPQPADAVQEPAAASTHGAAAVFARDRVHMTALALLLVIAAGATLLAVERFAPSRLRRIVPTQKRWRFTARDCRIGRRARPKA